MEQPRSHSRSSLMHLLRAGLPISEAVSENWMDAPTSVQQLRSLLNKEITRSIEDDISLLVFRVNHRPFGLVGDDDSQFGQLHPHLRQTLEALHPGIRAVGCQSGQILGFAPRLQRRTDGQALLNEITRALSDPVMVDGLRVLLAPRAGGAVLDAENEEATSLLAASKLALSEADASKVSIMFHPYHQSRQIRSAEMARDLHDAVINRSLSTRYQPDIDLATGEIVAIKAYAYWERNGTAVPNGDLFAAAEHASLQVPIGREVIEEALNTVYSWITGGLLPRTTLWVNVHPAEVVSPDFGTAMSTVATFDERLRLGIELTENPSNDRTFVYDVLRGLTAKGATAAIGGFGMGYLNLSEFQTLPFSAAKIDRALTKQISANNASAKLVSTVASLAQLLNLEVTAHGIESIEQALQARAAGCHMGQGYFFSKPLSTDEMRELLTQVRLGNKTFL